MTDDEEGEDKVVRQIGWSHDRWRRLWVTSVALICAATLGVGGCSSEASPPGPQVISDKGSPFADLLVPKLQASVTDGAIGVSVDFPVTVSSGDGVLGPVSLVNNQGVAVDGRPSLP